MLDFSVVENVRKLAGVPVVMHGGSGVSEEDYSLVSNDSDKGNHYGKNWIFISKEILNPEIVLERIDELLSLLFEQKVHIVEVLPNDSTRIAEESSLVIMDSVVQQ